ncbi:hypothetical protein FRC02_007395 [Tulasnella sp. 418]|nr:hypothetical protein FRC02_007395 [Tulasnella sp. 418]
MQNLYNATYREEEREVMPLLGELGVGYIPWMPLAGEFLARSTKEVTPRCSSSVEVNTQKEPFLVTIN